MEDFNTRGFSDRITQPVMTMAGTHNHLVPFSQLHRQIDTLANAQSVTARIFTRREEAHNHCQVGNLNSLLAEFKSWMTAHVSAPRRPVLTLREPSRPGGKPSRAPEKPHQQPTARLPPHRHWMLR